MSEEKKMTDEELKQAFFILRHGSSEGLIEYIKAVLAIENEYNLQKAEIERLTEENENLKADILRYEDIEFTEKHCNLYSENEALKQWLKRVNADNEVLKKQVDELQSKNTELQSQVDNLMGELDISDETIARLKKQCEKAVKDTAKKIWSKGKHFYKQYPLSTEVGLCCLGDWIKETYGVEVE